MAEKPETIFKRKIRPHLERLPHSWWEKIQQVGIRGTPDFLGCVNGWFVGIELKAGPSARLAHLQEYKLKQIRKAGGFGLVAYPENWQSILEFLQTIATTEGKAHAEINLWATAHREFYEGQDKTRKLLKNKEPASRL